MLFPFRDSAMPVTHVSPTLLSSGHVPYGKRNGQGNVFSGGKLCTPDFSWDLVF